MADISKSPQRMTFQSESHKQKLSDPDPEKRANAQAMIELYSKWKADADAQELDTEWQKNNMEYDMRTSDWMLAKVRANKTYAQNLYAAMCNNEFVKNDVWPILKDQRWSCSWRHAGGIVADMRQEGDYIDWYCSGIGDGLGNGDADRLLDYVSESEVTDEIREDLFRLGWIVVDQEQDI
jgi:hypothetical protein